MFAKIFLQKICSVKSFFTIFALAFEGNLRASVFGKMPEWSNGPHSKCGVRATVPGVRIPLFPQQAEIRNEVQQMLHLVVLFMAIAAKFI